MVEIAAGADAAKTCANRPLDRNRVSPCVGIVVAHLSQHRIGVKRAANMGRLRRQWVTVPFRPAQAVLLRQPHLDQGPAVDLLVVERCFIRIALISEMRIHCAVMGVFGECRLAIPRIPRTFRRIGTIL